MRERKARANPKRRDCGERGGLNGNQHADGHRNSVHLVVKGNAANEPGLQWNKISQRAGAYQREHFTKLNLDWWACSVGQNQHARRGAQRDQRNATQQRGEKNWRRVREMLPRLACDCAAARDGPYSGGEQAQSND